MTRIKPAEKLQFTLGEKYKAYLANGATPTNQHSNPLNLFDDSNQKDRAWLRRAKKYLLSAKIPAVNSPES